MQNMTNYTPHRWQLECCTFLNTCLMTSDHAYIQAPTGTGKTFAIALHGEQAPFVGYRMIIVGTAKVAKQHRKSLIEFGFTPVGDTDFDSPAGHRWIVATWQGVAVNPKNYERDMPGALLYFDEAHLGGSNEINKSYKKIVSALKPLKRVMISATTNVVSEKLLGKREGFSFVYTMSQAYEDDLLNTVHMIEVETGVSATVARIESAFGRNMEEIEELTDSETGQSRSPAQREGCIDSQNCA